MKFLRPTIFVHLNCSLQWGVWSMKEKKPSQNARSVLHTMSSCFIMSKQSQIVDTFVVFWWNILHTLGSLVQGAQQAGKLRLLLCGRRDASIAAINPQQLEVGVSLYSLQWISWSRCNTTTARSSSGPLCQIVTPLQPEYQLSPL